MATGQTDLLREAAARQELALSLCPERSDVYRTAISYARLGAARVLLGDVAAGRAALERATVLFPGYALPVAWLGYVAFVEGDLDQAAGLLKRAIIDLGPPDGAVAAVAQRYVDKI
jgi:Flp pilus assembly protein TadD